MKKYIYTLVLILFLNSSFLIMNSFAQWEPDVRLTNDPANSYTSSGKRGITANGNIIHVVWQEQRDGNNEIYYKRSNDGGTTWGADTRLTNNTANSYAPSIAVSGSQVHVIWHDYRDDNFEIYYKRSTDGGTIWGADTRMTNNTAQSLHPCLFVSGSQIHVVWYDDRDVNQEIYYKRSTDGGTTWGADTRLTNNDSGSLNPFISVSGSNYHLVWLDHRDTNGGNIYYKRSTDGGVTWGADTRLSVNDASSKYPSIVVTGSQVNIVWQDYRDTNWEIYYKRSTDGGTTWESDVRLTNNTLNSREPFLAVSGSQLNVVWNDDRDGSEEIYNKRSTDGGTTWNADERLTNDIDHSNYPSIVLSGSQAFAVWTDDRDGNTEVYFKRTVPPIPAVPLLISPVNNSTGQLLSLNLVWNKPLYSTKYKVLVATDSLFNNIILNDSLLTDSVKNLTNLNTLTKYYWKVSAGNIAGWGNFSSVWNFTTVPPIPIAPVLVSPPNNVTNQVPNLLLDWNNVQYAAGYRVQIANDSLFTSLVFDTSNVNRDSLRVRLGLLIVNTKYFWRVNATNVSGTGPWSTVWNFRISPVGLISLNSELPTEYKLYQNYPNPFNPATIIKFDVPACHSSGSWNPVKLIVYDIQGRNVATLVNEQLQPGTYEATFNGSSLTSGVYFYKLTSDDFVETKKMLMLK